MCNFLGSIKQFFAKGVSSEAQIQQLKMFIRQLLAALVYLKSLKIVHSDIKAQNILISHENQAKFIDFGCSRLVGAGDEKAKVDLQSGGHFNGTVPWMAPEALLGDDRGCPFKSDIWSFGCMLVEVVTQERPWSHIATENVFQLVLEISTGGGVPEVSSAVPAGLREFIGACLIRDPQKRPSAE